MTISTMEFDSEADVGMVNRLFVHRDEKGRSFSTSTPFVHSSEHSKGLRSLPGSSILAAPCDDSGLGASINNDSCATSFADCSRTTGVSESMCITPTYKLDLPKASHTGDLSQSPLSRWSYLGRRSLDSSLDEHDNTLDVVEASFNSSRSSCARRLNLDLDLDASSDSEEDCIVNDTGFEFDQSCEQSLVKSVGHLTPTPPVQSEQANSFNLVGHFNDESGLVNQFNDLLQKFSPPEADRLIGRKMGLELVDIVGELATRNVTDCLSSILSYLESKDLCRMCCVNRQWQNVCSNDPSARKRRKKYIREKQCYLEEIGKENSDKQPPPSRHTRVATVSSDLTVRALTTVQMTSDTPQNPALRGKKHKTTTDIFSQAAEDLRHGETLHKCPKCLKPAKILPAQEQGHCRNSDCDYKYCTKCMHAYHGSKDCAPILAKRTKTDSVGSKKSKKNLKRL